MQTLTLIWNPFSWLSAKNDNFQTFYLINSFYWYGTQTKDYLRGWGVLWITYCVCACALKHSPEGTEAYTPNHVEKSVKYEQTQQQIEEYGLWDNHTGRGWPTMEQWKISTKHIIARPQTGALFAVLHMIGYRAAVGGICVVGRDQLPAAKPDRLHAFVSKERIFCLHTMRQTTGAASGHILLCIGPHVISLESIPIDKNTLKHREM